MSQQTQSNSHIHHQSREDYVDNQMKKHNRFYKDIYNVLYTLNDFTIAFWFLVGSIFFYFESLKTWGVTLFVIASFQFMIKPTIRLVHEIKARGHYGREYDEMKEN
ncbi:YrhK family protein [Aquisalibacillus elongatus]|uniref:YrhK-like protein n=1 Tax=Aquisalibacillus elongatus TaxID=485577 RepID=A0A3N5B522_9BACI|nr:YrhK family protein [Aquisalibacillus elongatus]RPF52209.1 YrhK-like protein [Aquisalibacillus elongatus]